jgi:hypothetical protein
MGATEAAALASEAPSEYPRLVLVEGAYRIAPTASFAASYARGGQRALFGCTTLGGCAHRRHEPRRAQRRQPIRVFAITTSSNESEPSGPSVM